MIFSAGARNPSIAFNLPTALTTQIPRFLGEKRSLRRKGSREKKMVDMPMIDKEESNRVGTSACL
jgi:hypothetical protein